MFVIMLTATNSGSGGHSQFFVKDLGLALAPKMCPSQAFEKVNSSQAYTSGRKKKDLLLSGRSNFQVLQRIIVESFRQILEELTA